MRLPRIDTEMRHHITSGMRLGFTLAVFSLVLAVVGLVIDDDARASDLLTTPVLMFVLGTVGGATFSWALPRFGGVERLGARVKAGFVGGFVVGLLVTPLFVALMRIHSFPNPVLLSAFVLLGPALTGALFAAPRYVPQHRDSAA